MEEISCNVIQDLLPSYVDEICSGDSRLLIEEHLRGCEQCRTQLELLKNIELTDVQGEQKRISYLKEVKKGIISLIFLTLLIISGVWFMMYHSEIIGNSVFYIAFPLVIAAVYGLLPNSPLSARRSKFSVLLMLSSIGLMVYFAVLFGWGMQINSAQSGLYGIPLNEIGLFLQRQLIVIIVIQIGIFILSNILILYGYQVNKCIYGISLTSVYLAVGYSCLLHNMSTADEFCRLLSELTGVVVLEGAVFSAAAHIFAKKILIFGENG